MFHPLRLVLALFLGALAASAADVNLFLEKLELKNGRTYQKVTLKTYDPVSRNVALQVERSIVSVQLSLLPDDLAARLTALVPDPPQSVSHQPQVRNNPQPSRTSNRQEPSAASRQAQQDDQREQRLMYSLQEKADERARNYFRFEYRIGSGSVLASRVTIEAEPPEPISGWHLRYRIKGRAMLQYYDTVGSFNRMTRDYEIELEATDRGFVKVLELTVK